MTSPFIDRDGVLCYCHADGLGSVVALTDANETIAETYAYTPFGAVERMGGVKNTFTRTGREWDEETGLYYYRARYYDPEVGRFIGKDPIDFAGGDVNLRYACTRSRALNPSPSRKRAYGAGVCGEEVQEVAAKE